jgi:hypothetical protein
VDRNAVQSLDDVSEAYPRALPRRIWSNVTGLDASGGIEP